ncbi:hypothetical protein [uncultured Desulfuromonas sp.]|uniref:hypothetical protein n=1 Tax=uncultured Desulfuromonas sp. TaxID=181013 RepID=UPI002AABF1A6|nr:hypothetical protein [uncultured Desulfuromonas sp.]
MTETTSSMTILLSVALFSNIPLGYLRQGVAKRSALWMLYIHLSIPFLFTLRHHYGFSWRVIPFTLSCAVIGQLVGGRLRKRADRI